MNGWIKNKILTPFIGKIDKIHLCFLLVLSSLPSSSLSPFSPVPHSLLFFFFSSSPSSSFSSSLLFLSLTHLILLMIMWFILVYSIWWDFTYFFPKVLINSLKTFIKYSFLCHWLKLLQDVDSCFLILMSLVPAARPRTSHLLTWMFDVFVLPHLAPVMGWIVFFQNSCIEVLTPGTSVCDCVWR